MAHGTCAICGEKGKFVYSLPIVLRDLGIEGVMAHVGCVLALKKKLEAKSFRQGSRPTQVVRNRSMSCI